MTILAQISFGRYLLGTKREVCLGLKLGVEEKEEKIAFDVGVGVQLETRDRIRIM